MLDECGGEMSDFSFLNANWMARNISIFISFTINTGREKNVNIIPIRVKPCQTFFVALNHYTFRYTDGVS